MILFKVRQCVLARDQRLRQSQSRQLSRLFTLNNIFSSNKSQTRVIYMLLTKPNAQILLLKHEVYNVHWCSDDYIRLIREKLPV